MQRFNLAYRPSEAGLAKRCVDYAQNFSSISAEYLLNGVSALPHVTLCQFNADPSRLSGIWDKSRSIVPNTISVSFDRFYVADYGDRYLWIGFAVERSSSLIEGQAAVSSFIYGTVGDPIFTGSGDAYLPHLTLARTTRDLAAAKPVFGQIRWLENFYGRDHGFSLSLGLSDENGVFLKDLYSN